MPKFLFLVFAALLSGACSHHHAMQHDAAEATSQAHGHKQMATPTEAAHGHGHGETGVSHQLEQLRPDQIAKRYRFAFSTNPPKPIAGEPFEITVRITDPAGNPIATLEEHHERLAHFLLVSENLEELHHLHPEDFGLLTEAARQEARFTFPATVRWGGRHVLRADFADQGFGVATQFEFKVKGLKQPRTQWDLNPSRKQNGLSLALNLLPPHLEERTRAECNILLGDNKGPVTDLEKFLGALTHLAIFREGASDSAHVHGGGVEFAHMHYVEPVPNYRGPKLYFGYRFMKPGRYRIFAQFQRAGIVYTVPFDVEVGESTLDIGG